MSELINENTRGVYVISATPFTENGQLDLESTDSLVEFYLEKGVHGLTILGMMGEAAKLDAAESAIFITRVLDRVSGRVPVVVGVSNTGLNNMIDLTRSSMDKGAASVMIAPPPSLLTENHIVNYFDAVFEALGPGVPVCYQDYPANTGVHISVDTFHRLVDSHNDLVMLKHEDFPALKKLTAILGAADRGEHRRVSVLVANGGLSYPLEMRRGADGIMTGFTYPEMLVEVYGLFESGKADSAEDLYDLYLPILRYEFQPGVGLAIRKEVLRRRGAIACSKTRAPGPALDADDLAELTKLMERLKQKLEN